MPTPSLNYERRILLPRIASAGTELYSGHTVVIGSLPRRRKMALCTRQSTAWRLPLTRFPHPRTWKRAPTRPSPFIPSLQHSALRIYLPSLVLCRTQSLRSFNCRAARASNTYYEDIYYRYFLTLTGCPTAPGRPIGNEGSIMSTVLIATVTSNFFFFSLD